MIDELYNYKSGFDLFAYYLGSVVVVDSLYGSLKLATLLVERDVHIVCKCRSDRPSFIFKNYLYKILEKSHDGDKVGNTVSCTGYIRRNDGSYVKFSAYTIVTQSRSGAKIKNNFISTIHNAGENCLESTDNEIIELKNGKRLVYTKCIFHTESVISFYNQQAGFIDETNDYVLGSFPEIRSMRWKLSVFYLFLFSWIHNARMIFNELPTTQEKLNSLKFRKQLCDELVPRHDNNMTHQLERKTKEKSQRGRCKICYNLKKTDKKTYFICTGCKIYCCQSCFEGDIHYQYIDTHYFRKFSSTRSINI